MSQQRFFFTAEFISKLDTWIYDVRRTDNREGDRGNICTTEVSIAYSTGKVKIELFFMILSPFYYQKRYLPEPRRAQQLS